MDGRSPFPPTSMKNNFILSDHYIFLYRSFEKTRGRVLMLFLSWESYCGNGMLGDQDPQNDPQNLVKKIL